MAVKTQARRMPRATTTTNRRTNNKRKTKPVIPLPDPKSPIMRFMPAWVVLGAVLVILLPNVMTVSLQAGGRVLANIPRWAQGIVTGTNTIAPLFSAEIQHWSADIGRWAAAYDLDPNLLATVMQIESCGHPSIGSSAGAQGLFQVMPFHFSAGEVMTDPETNANRGVNYLKQCVGFADGDTALAMACYNGGPSVLGKAMSNWHSETRRYYYWGTGIYEAATQQQSYSNRLNEWMNAGGAVLCDMASAELGI